MAASVHHMQNRQSQEGKNRELHNAIIKKDFAKVAECLAKEADVNWTDDEGHTALYRAVRSVADTDPEYKIIKLLLQHKDTDINKPDRAKWTPLHSAFKSGYGDIVNLLIEAGADVNRKNDDGLKYNEVQTHKTLTYRKK